MVLLAALLSACGSTAAPASPASQTTTPATAPASPPKPLTKLSVRMSYLMFGPFQPAALAVVNGYYNKLGLDVQLQEGSGSSTVAQLVGRGTDPVALMDAPTMALAISHGVPAKVVAVFQQKNPDAILTLASSNITTPQQLVGKRIAYDPGGAYYELFQGVLAQQHLSLSQMKMVGAAGHAKVAAVAQGRADALLGAMDDEWFDLQEMTHDAPEHAILYADYGPPLFGSGVAVNDDYLKAHGEIVKAFVQGTIEGWQAAIKDPQAAAEAANKLFPAHKTSVLLGQMKQEVQLVHSKLTEGKIVGYQSPQAWQQTLDTLKKYVDPKLNPDPSLYYTNEYLPQQ